MDPTEETVAGTHVDGGPLPEPTDIEPATLERGATIGRYVVLERLGAGGMGVVYTAYDPELDRKLAIKLVRNPRRGGPEARSRLQREAQAMAKLAHPNVITVHDVGLVDGRVFIAMEYVDGETLGEWMSGNPEVDAILDTFVAAGEGLVAAHEAGLVHRDFKPDNVLLGKDGRVRVMDFGLARANEDDPDVEERPLAEREETFDEADSQTLTATGAIMGTPAYMAPEQHMGVQADVRADQFAFCVALHEALFGARPFAGSTAHALALSVLSGDRVPVPKASEAPSWIEPILSRGLATDPDERFDSMRALLDAIAAQRTPTEATNNRRGRVALLAALVFAGGIGLAAAFDRGGAPSGPCDAAGSDIDRAWGSAQRQAITDAFAQQGLPVDATIAALDAYAEGWTAARTENCEATRVRGAQSDQLMDLRTACLDRRRAELGATVDVLAGGSQSALAEARQSIEGLTPVEVCDNVERLQVRVPPPDDPVARKAVEDAEAVLDEASALHAAGLYTEGLARLDSIDDDDPAFEHPPLAASAGLLRAELYVGRGRYAEADAVLEDAALLAARGRDDRLRAEIELVASNVVGNHNGEIAEGRRLLASARTTIARLGSPPDLLWSQRELDAQLTWRGGDPEASERMNEALLADLEAAGLGDSERASQTKRRLAALLANRGEYAKAEAIFRASLDELGETLGEDHPGLLTPLGNLANSLAQRGETEAARELQLRALAIAEARLGEDHPETALVHESMGVMYYHMGQMEEAKSSLDRAVKGYSAAYDDSHPALIRARGNLGGVLLEIDDYDEAERVLTKSRDVLVDRFGRDHDYLVFVLFNLTSLYIQTDRFAEARESVDWAIDIARQKFGAISERVGEGLEHSGDVYAATGEVELAIADYRRALDMHAQLETPEGNIAHCERALANALLQTPDRRDEGETLLVTAYRRATAAGPVATSTVERIREEADEFGVALPEPAPRD